MRCFQSIAALAVATVICGFASAASPEVIQQGRLLFEKDWSPQNPAFGSDGLGPLFNAKSCVACHHQGGVGGGGDSRFNAKTLGVEAIQLVGRATPTKVASLLRTLHPGLVQPSGAMVATATIPHFGGSPQMEALRARYRNHASSEAADEGGAASAADVRENMTASWKWSGASGGLGMHVEARIFQRNTTALFGAGLIDQVSDAQIKQMEAVQKRHPEISGRVSNTRTGEIGRFGWRGNLSRLISFVDQACANEMGLETRRRNQPSDIVDRSYRNPSHDIDDKQVEAMAEFIADLPAPVQQLADDSNGREQQIRGEAVFESVGCTVCHVKSIGPAKGLYSDLLLHDMGERLYDYDTAEPQVKSQRLAATLVQVSSTRSTAYYGAPTPMFASGPPRSPSSTAQRRRPQSFRQGIVQTPRFSNATSDLIPIRRGEVRTISQTIDGATTQAEFQEQTSLRRTFRPTLVAQEWRTPPLWGVADSAPYMHDGRAETLMEAIAMHGGESAGTRDRFLNLSYDDRQAVIKFLESLVTPPGVPQMAN